MTKTVEDSMKKLKMELVTTFLFFVFLGISNNSQAMKTPNAYLFPDTHNTTVEQHDEYSPFNNFPHLHYKRTQDNDSDHGEDSLISLTHRSSGILSPQTEVISPVTYPYHTAQRDDENSEQEAAIARIADEEHHHLEPKHMAIHEDIEPAHFTEEEYEHYLQRIKSLDPEVYAALVRYQEKFHAPAFLKARNEQQATVRLPLPESPQFPRMILPENLSDKELEHYIESFRALRIVPAPRNLPATFRTHSTFLPNSELLNDEFSNADYAHYMKLIEEIDPNILRHLQTTEAGWFRGKAIFKAYKGEKPGIEWRQNQNVKSPESYPILLLHPLEGDDEQQIQILRTILKQHITQNTDQEEVEENTGPLDQEDIRRILGIIKILAPEVHKAIITPDPDGTNHIQTNDKKGAGIYISLAQDGLPLIFLEKHDMKKSDADLLLILAHELGHYVHQDVLDGSRLTHKKISLSHTGPLSRLFQTNTGKAVHVTGKFSPVEVLRNRRRQQEEYAADAFAVRQPNVSFENAKDIQQELLKADEEGQHAFAKEHPLIIRTSRGSDQQLERDIASLGRIEQMKLGTAQAEQLRSQGKEPIPFDWKAIIAIYKKAMQPPPKANQAE